MQTAIYPSIYPTCFLYCRFCDKDTSHQICEDEQHVLIAYVCLTCYEQFLREILEAE